VQEQVADMLKVMDKWGGPETYPHMAAGWAVAFDTPYKWTKQVASDHGGTKVGMAVHWPKGIKARGEQRNQFHHVIDVAPTILEAARLPEPRVVNGVPQRPMDGVSMVYTFDDAGAKDRHITQYFEMFGNRAIYHDGWFARTIHKAPWEREPRRSLAEDIWELYDTSSDFSLVSDLAAKRPETLAELQALFMYEAEKNHALPIDDRVFERLIPAMVDRPDLMAGRTSLTLAEGMTGMTENVFLDIKNKSKTITARIEVPEEGAHGAIIVQGGRFGGWALYVKDGMPARNSGPATRPSDSSSPMTARDRARAAWARCTSTTCRSRSVVSNERRQSSSPPTKRPMSVSTSPRRSSRPSVPSAGRGSPAGFTASRSASNNDLMISVE
jgi:hypothetical protein